MDEDTIKEEQPVEEDVEKNTDTEPEEAVPADDEKATETVAASDAIKAAQSALDGMKDKYMRLQADYANYKKRTANEKTQLSDVVKIDVLKEILPVLDNFERALQVPPDSLTEDSKSFLEGCEMIYKQLVGVLQKEGLTKMEAVGKPFDPQYHEAVMRTPSDEYDNDIVIEVLQAGYLLGDKTVRPAMVKVAFNG